MAGFLRALGAAVLLLGLGVAALAAWSFSGDEHFQEVALAYARHPEHTLFQAEYWTAAVRHYGLLATVIGGALGGLVVGGVLLALAELLRRSPPRDTS